MYIHKWDIPRLSVLQALRKNAEDTVLLIVNPFAPGDFAEKRILKLVEWFSGHCCAIKS